MLQGEMMKGVLKLIVVPVVLMGTAACSSQVKEQPQQPQTVQARAQAAGTSKNVGTPVAPAEPQVDLAKASKYNVQLGIAYLQRGQIQRAKSKLLLAQKQQPDSATVRSALGYFYEATGEQKLAEQSYKASVDMAPHSGNMLNNYGAFLCREKKYKDAERYFMKAVKQESYVHTAEAYENAGLCALLEPDVKTAQRYFSKALMYNPKRTTSLYEMAAILHNDGQNKQAAQYLKQFNANSAPTASSLWLDIQIQTALGNKNSVASNALLLKNKFPNSDAYKQYQTWQGKLSS